VTERKSVYLEEYLAAHNNALEQHPRYRLDMNITLGNGRGDLVFATSNNVTNPEDEKVFTDVIHLVAQTHKLIIL
jgi:hypothetical protein